jgi:hypothetical protein
MSDDGSASWNECLVCKETHNDEEKTYAHENAHVEANKRANEIASKISFNQKEYEYIEYYMFLYRLHYKKEYDSLFSEFKEKRYNLILERFSTASEKEICCYHQESISWRK